jgi:hypothetical protein
LWGPPALFAVCRNCHRDKLHKRFARPHSWLAFVAHVRRGGYTRELAEPELRRAVAALAKALSVGRPAFELSSRRAYASTVGEEWFANLSCHGQPSSSQAEVVRRLSRQDLAAERG